MTAAPSGQSKADAPNQDPVTNAAQTENKKTGTRSGNPAEGAPLPEPTTEGQFDPAPVVAGPNEPTPEGQVEVIRKDPENEQSDPGGNVSEVRKTSKRTAPKKDPLTEYIPTEKLPVAVTVGQIVASVETYAGNAVLALSLKGWVGDAPLKIRAEDVGEIEQAIAELRKEISR